MKNWYKSKTIRLAIAQALVGVLVAFFAVYPELQTVGWLTVAKSAFDFYLRFKTTEAVV